MYKVKKIISLFLKKEPEEINSCTYIDYRGIRSSIMLHRMYSALRAEGINIRETSKIQTFGDLMSHINSGDDPINFHKEKNISLTPISSLPSSQIKIGSSPFNVGIDIESIDQFHWKLELPVITPEGVSVPANIPLLTVGALC